MIDILKKFYEIEIDQFEEVNEGILFCIDGIYYYFIKTIFDEDYLKKTYDICFFIRSKNIRIHDFVLNNKGSLLSDGFVLFKINTFVENVRIEDVSLFNIIINEYKDEYVSFEKFWEDKIDYLELQLSELSTSKLVNNSFDYFVGISELLLSFYKDNYLYDGNVYLVHKSFKSLSTLDFYNPLNITLGCRYKDVVSYIKMTSNFELLYNLLAKISTNEKVYLFCRMCFPFKYFDIVNDIVLNDKSEEVLIDIVENVSFYEKFLLEMEKVFGIYLFHWIKKE